MITVAEYQVNLYLDGEFVGDVRPLAQQLKWTRRRTHKGTDSIDFTVNDVLLQKWLKQRGRDLVDVLRPIALECRIIRNGVPIVGGFLATMPAYQPRGTSTNFQMKFDGFLNLLNGVIIAPQTAQTKRLSQMIVEWVNIANQRSQSAGKGFGLTAGTIVDLATVSQTFDGYKTIKSFITDRADNTTGAGIFDIYFHEDKTFDIFPDAEFGTVRQYIVDYPTQLNAISATAISANEITGFASKVIAVGAGETSATEEMNTAITSEALNREAVLKYGYFETLFQESSISIQQTLDNRCESELANASQIQWQPQIKLTGRNISPSPTGEPCIWIGDTVQIHNSEDLTELTSGWFRVQELDVSVGATGAETITPTLERVEPPESVL